MVHPLRGLDNHRPSSDQPPAGSLPAFAWGDRFSPYPCPLQARPSLVPASFTSRSLENSCEPPCPDQPPASDCALTWASDARKHPRQRHEGATVLNRTYKDVSENACRTGRRGRLPTFHTSNKDREDSADSAGGAMSACADQAAAQPTTLRFGLGLSNA